MVCGGARTARACNRALDWRHNDGHSGDISGDFAELTRMNRESVIRTGRTQFPPAGADRVADRRANRCLYGRFARRLVALC